MEALSTFAKTEMSLAAECTFEMSLPFFEWRGEDIVGVTISFSHGFDHRETCRSSHQTLVSARTKHEGPPHRLG